MSNAPVVSVVGSTMMDMITYADKLPAAGETVVGRGFTLGFGGKGANQAVMAALLGAEVAMINCLGSDTFGDMTLQNFEQLGIDRRCVEQLPGESSGVAAIWVEPGGENRIVITPGANNRITRDHIDKAFRVLARPRIVLCQLEIPQEAVRWTFERARAIGATTVFNPAPAVPIDKRVLEHTTWLIPNEREFAVIAQDVLGATPAAFELPDAIRDIAGRLRVNVVVTLGEKGALLYEADGNAGVRDIPAVGALAVDTTGAGDAFVGAFSYALGIKRSPIEAVRLACACASSSVTRKGTQTSFPRGAELRQIRERVWR